MQKYKFVCCAEYVFAKYSNLYGVWDVFFSTTKRTKYKGFTGHVPNRLCSGCSLLLSELVLSGLGSILNGMVY